MTIQPSEIAEILKEELDINPEQANAAAEKIREKINENADPHIIAKKTETILKTLKKKVLPK